MSDNTSNENQIAASNSESSWRERMKQIGKRGF